MGQNKPIANLPIPRITRESFDAIPIDLAGRFNFTFAGYINIAKFAKCQKKTKENELKDRAAKPHNPRSVIRENAIFVLLHVIAAKQFTLS